MLEITALKQRLAQTIENSFTGHFMKYQSGEALERELEQDKEIKALFLKLQSGEQGALSGMIDKIEQEATYKGFKQGFNVALELLGQKPLFNEEEIK